MRFSVWAPTPTRLRLQLRDEALAMQRDTEREGWWTVETDADHGDAYAFLLDDDQTPRPDPRSLWQPDGVDGPSKVFGTP